MKSGNRQAFAIINYHRIDFGQKIPIAHRKANLVIPIESFLEDISVLTQNANVLHLPDALGLLTKEELPRRSIALTFDDGFMEHAFVAPLLLENSLPATFFIPSCAFEVDMEPRFIEWLAELTEVTSEDYLNICRQMRTIKSNKRVSLLKAMTKKAGILEMEVMASCREHYISKTDIQNIAREKMFDVGAHTESHPNIAGLQNSEAFMEISESIKRLRIVVKKRQVSFAYPFGGYDSMSAFTHQTLCELRVAVAVSAIPSLVFECSNRLALGRFDRNLFSCQQVLDNLEEFQYG